MANRSIGDGRDLALLCHCFPLQVGVTTDAIDKAVHQTIIDNGAYPSPLTYGNFPKSVCTSVNECICHGIPDSRALVDGDIINIDVTVYLDVSAHCSSKLAKLKLCSVSSLTHLSASEICRMCTDVLRVVCHGMTCCYILQKSAGYAVLLPTPTMGRHITLGVSLVPMRGWPGRLRMAVQGRPPAPMVTLCATTGLPRGHVADVLRGHCQRARAEAVRGHAAGHGGRHTPMRPRRAGEEHRQGAGMRRPCVQAHLSPRDVPAASLMRLHAA